MTVIIKNGSSKKKIEAAVKRLEKKNKGKSMLEFYGKLKGTFGDGLEYQKKLRDEWN